MFQCSSQPTQNVRKSCKDDTDETQPESHVHKLKDLCCTRWIKRIDALDRFQKLHTSIAACMESILAEGRSGWSQDSLTDASTLLLAITTTEFVSALVITTKCLLYLLGFTCSLQAEVKGYCPSCS